MSTPHSPVETQVRGKSPSPQFSLLALFKWVTALGVLFALMHWAGAFWAWAILLLALLVAAHVAGNYLGTRLREESSADLARADGRQKPPVHQISRSEDGDHVVRQTTPTQLQERFSLGWSIPTACGLSAITLAALAMIFLTGVENPPLSIATIYFGAASAAVIGGIWGFLAASFVRAVRLAWCEASPRKAQAPKRAA